LIRYGGIYHFIDHCKEYPPNMGLPHGRGRRWRKAMPPRGLKSRQTPSPSTDVGAQLHVARSLMIEALAILDRHAVSSAAATLDLALHRLDHEMGCDGPQFDRSAGPE
jgi:hypothetical protein